MQPTQPRLLHAVLCVTVVFVMVFLGLFFWHIQLHSIMLMSIAWVAFNAYVLDSNLNRLAQGMRSAVQKSAIVFLIFILIGAIIAAFIIAGAIPTLIYFGLSFLSPHAFLPQAMLLCSIISISLGTSWGTIGTMGIALIGVASIFHIPLPMAAGAIVSGAYFGDKLSPISDTTILSALSTQTPLYRHIKGMTYSLLPAYIITLFLFTLIGLHVHPATTSSELFLIQHLIIKQFHIGFISLLPVFVLFGLSFRKKSAEFSMLLAIMTAIVIAICIQGMSLEVCLNSLFLGPHFHHQQNPLLDRVLNHGGIQTMLWSMSLTLLILTLGGLLESYHFITVLFEKLISALKKPFSLVFATVWSCVFCNILMGEAYLSIILMSRTFKQAYKNMNLDSCVLSKAVDEGSTFSTPLIPWTTSGMFISTTLGVNPTDYLFWSLFNWIAPLTFFVLVAFHFFGIKQYTQR
ncbi:MAG: Na+/H+ antiporter NhaC [Gammaproteobacteria bacterium]|nr:Na+/H+ antiporter NhaC [Gammaproteobacteria bacterium]